MAKNEIDLHSDEIQEIIGYIPSWITRWGVTLLFGILCLLLFISYNIKYPDELKVNVIIQSKEQPGRVNLKKSDANQEYIFKVREGSNVSPGDTLFIYKDNSKHIVKYIKTPMKGKVYISNGMDETNIQDIAVWVVPVMKAFDVKIKFPNHGAGKVKIHQKVLIYLNDYPSDEFGFLEGHIVSIFPVVIDNNGNSEAFVKLNKGLVTNNGLKLPIKYILTGKGAIQLNDKSIFERIFGVFFNIKK